MKFLKFENSVKYVKGETCEVLEYPLDDKDINCAVAEINGRYPEKGYSTNQVCKELVYVIKGNGTLYIKNGKSVNFNQKDVILIDKGECFYWEGICTLILPCTPSWYPEQYEFRISYFVKAISFLNTI